MKGVEARRVGRRVDASTVRSKQRGGAGMRLHKGRYECFYCGAVRDLPGDQDPQVVIHATSGKPNVRVVSIEGREVHRCEVIRGR